MNVYTHNQFEGRYPVGTAAVVVAKNAQDAAILLENKLVSIGLKQTIKPADLKEVNVKVPDCIILQDGDY